MILCYKKAAQMSYDGWSNEALPLGNGKIGAKIFGGTDCELIHFNEKTLWSGGRDVDGFDGGITNCDEGKAFREIQDLLSEGKNKQAEKMMSKLQGNMTGFGAYQSFGNLYFQFTDSDKSEKYLRDLDLDSASAMVSYEKDGTVFNRHYFISYPDNVFVGRLRVEKGERKLSFNAYAVSDQKGESKAENGEITLCGFVNANKGVNAEAGKDKNSMKYACFIKLIPQGGTMESKENGTVEIRDAESVLVIMSLGTNYVNDYPNYLKDTDPLPEVRERVLTASKKTFGELYRTHLDDYEALFKRVKLTLTEDEDLFATDSLLKLVKKSGQKKKQLYNLLYDYGRYLLIASSRDGTLPANLQGIWNAKNDPPWTCDYHFNVNIQMNYFGAYSGNLAETALPYIDFINSIRKPGRVTANKTLGIGEKNEKGEPDYEKPTGWVCHTMVSPLGFVGSGEWWHWGWAPTNGAWALDHTYDYYRYTLDTEKLSKDIYPAMEECALLWTKLLIEEKGSGRMICSPGFSPEHGPLSAGITYDQSIIYNLFDKTIDAAKILCENGKKAEVNEKLIEELKAILPKLQPISVGKWGQIKEWYEEDTFFMRGFYNKTVQRKHRHLSHLLGLYPFNIINPEDEKLKKACFTSLEDRGYKSTGWATAYRVLCYARIYEGDICEKLLKSFVDNCVLNNLLSTHPPFQIDGSLGIMAAINEMLLQSHLGFIKILPALPKDWHTGEIKGIMARGNFEIDIEWKNDKLKEGKILSKSGGKCSLAYDGKIIFVEDEEGNEIETVYENGITTFLSEKGKTYKFS